MFLILNSFDKIIWEVSATPKTKIIKIIQGFAAYKNFLKADEEISVEKVKLPLVYKSESSSFKELQQYIKNNFGKTRMDSFTNSYYIPEIININTVDSGNEKLSIDYPKTEKSPIKTTFALVNSNGQKVNLSPEGPINGAFYPPESRVTDKTERYLFEAGNNSLIIKDLKTNETKNYPIPKNFEDFSHGKAVGYSSQSDIVVITSYHGGGGFLYRFDFKTRKWIDLITLGRGAIMLNKIVYDKNTNNFIATDNQSLIEITLDGKTLKKYRIWDNIPGYLEARRSDSSIITPLSMIPLKDHIILVMFEHGRHQFTISKSPTNIERIWVLDRKTNDAVLTYKNL